MGTTTNEEGRTSATDVAAELKRRLGELRSEVVDTLERCRREFEAAATSAADERRRDLSELRESVARLLDDAARERRSSAESESRSRRAFVTDVRWKVDDLLKDARERREAGSRDDAEARRRAVADIRSAVARQRNRGGKEAGPRPVESTPTPAPRSEAPTTGAGPAPTVDSTDGDDLTRISGIGKGIAARLESAGIRTFAALAALEPEAVRETLGPIASLGQVDRWIEDARRRSS